MARHPHRIRKLSALLFACLVTASAQRLQAVDQILWIAPPQQVSEGAGHLTFLIARSGNDSGAASVQVATGNLSALAGSDYTAVNTTLSWGAGDHSLRTVTVPILDDGVFEFYEYFSLTLSSPVNAAIPDPTQTILINDDDANPAGEVSIVTGDAQQRIWVGEGDGSLPLTVVRSGGSTGAVSVTVQIDPGSATASNDYTVPVSTVLSWADGESGPKVLTIPLIDDATPENSETFQASLTTLTGGVSYGSRTGAIITIVDDDPPIHGNLSWPTSLTVREDIGNAVLVVERIGGTQGAISIDYIMSDNSALAGSDYTAASGTLNWADGDGAAKTITIPIVDDGIAEATESFSLTFSNPGGGVLMPTTPWANVTIIDQDTTSGVIAFTNDYVTIDEGAGTVVLSVVRTGGSSGAVSVSYTMSDATAVDGSDYTAASGTLNWASGDATTRTISVPVTDTTIIDGARYFFVSLSGATGGALLGLSDAQVVITDNDVPTAGTFSFTTTNVQVSEGGGPVVLTVQRTGGSTGEVAVEYQVGSGTALVDEDFQVARNGTLIWADGDTADQTITIPLIDDAIAEGVESFSVGLVLASNGGVIAGSGVVITITDDDAATAGILRFSTPSVTVAETAGSAVITVQRTGGSSGAIGVTCATLLGATPTSARDGIDLTSVIQHLTWPSGDTSSRSVTVPILADHQPGPARTFRLVLSDPTGGAILDTVPGLPTALGTITNVDAAPAGTISIADASALENAGSAVLHVARSGGSSGAISIDYLTYGVTASDGVDFTVVAGTLQWADGDTADKTITVPLLDDALIEGDETVAVVLSSATGGALLSTSAATLTLHDDETNPAGQVQFAVASTTVHEGVGTIHLQVTRSGGTTGAVGVTYDLGDVGTAFGLDYTATASGTLSWSNGDAAAKTISITVLSDSITEAAETLHLTLRDPSGGATLGLADSDVVISDPLPPASSNSDSGSCGLGGGISSVMLLSLLALMGRWRSARDDH